VKILYIGNARSGNIWRWIEYFAERDYEVHVISTAPLEQGAIGSEQLHILKRYNIKIGIISFPTNLVSSVIQIKQLIKKISPDILNIHYITYNGFYGALSGFHPLVLSAMGSDILVEPSESKLYRMMTSFALRRADLITTPGENLVDPMIQLGADPDKIHLIHPGVDTEKFNPLKINSEKELMRSYSPTVISIRSLRPIYNVETLIKSVPIVLKQVPEARFIIGGGGEQRIYLRDLAKSLGVIDSINFTGFIPHDQLPGYFNSADIYVSTSLSDGGPSISLMEAMACGLACIVTNVGDTAKWIKNGETGYIIPVKRPDMLAENIISLIKNKKLRQKMGRSNLQLVQQKANYNKEMAKMAEIYDELIE